MKEGAMIDANKKSLAWRRNTAERGFCIASASTALAGRQRGLTDVARTIFPEKWCKMAILFGTPIVIYNVIIVDTCHLASQAAEMGFKAAWDKGARSIDYG